MIITKHAYKNLKKRTGLNKKAFDKLIRGAEKNGIRHKDTVGKLNGYFTKLYKKHLNATDTLIYNNFVFVCRKNVLITVFPVPHYIQVILKERK